MTDQKKHDHWGDLAENVGATPPPDDSPVGQPENGKTVDENARSEDTMQSPTGWGTTDSETIAEDVDQTPAENIKSIEIVARQVQSYRPKSGWDELATEFDLPQPEEAPDAKEEGSDATSFDTKSHGGDENQAVSDAIQAEALSEDTLVLEEVADNIQDEQEQATEEHPWLGADEFDALFDDSSSDDKIGDANEKSKDASFKEAIEADSKEIGWEEAEEEKSEGKRHKRRRRRPRKSDAKEDNLAAEDIEDEKSLRIEGEEIVSNIIRSEDTGGFGAGLFGDIESLKDASNIFASPEEVADASEILEITPSMSEEEVQQEESKDSRKKRGRRRRRRSSSKKKEAPAEESMDDKTVPQDDASNEEVIEKTDRRGSRKKRSAADRGDSASGRRDRSERSSEDGSKKQAVSHRGIPSWDEAIESIIATNMENRSKKSGGGSSSKSRGGRGRGEREKSGSRKRSN